MPIENRIRYTPLYEVLFTRESRQRTELTPASVIDLALSIKKSEWVNPILIDEDNTLMAGERRFTAVSLLHDVANKIPAEALNIPPEEYASIAHNLKPDLFDGWTKIPSQRGHRLTPLDLLVFEFIENDKRKDLPWQDRAAAVYSIHTMALESSESRWTAADTARLLSISSTIVGKYLRIMRAKNSDDAKLQSVVEESQTYQSAILAIDRVESRREDPLS